MDSVDIRGPAHRRGVAQARPAVALPPCQDLGLRPPPVGAMSRFATTAKWLARCRRLRRGRPDRQGEGPGVAANKPELAPRRSTRRRRAGDCPARNAALVLEPLMTIAALRNCSIESRTGAGETRLEMDSGRATLNPGAGRMCSSSTASVERVHGPAGGWVLIGAGQSRAISPRWRTCSITTSRDRSARGIRERLGPGGRALDRGMPDDVVRELTWMATARSSH